MNRSINSIMSVTKCDKRTAVEAIKKTKSEILAILLIIQSKNTGTAYRDNRLRFEYNPQFEEYSGDNLWGTLHGE